MRNVFIIHHQEQLSYPLYSNQEFIEILGKEISENKELFDRLAKIRSNGVEYDHGKTIEGIVSTATAINTFLGSLGISTLVPQHRFEQNKDFYIKINNSYCTMFLGSFLHDLGHF